jgi:hypothetical protein
MILCWQHLEELWRMACAPDQNRPMVNKQCHPPQALD